MENPAISNHTSIRPCLYHLRWWNGWIVVLLLVLLHALLAISAIWSKTVTFDETVHIGAGLSYWAQNRTVFNTENGNFPQRWGALPLWIAGYQLPPEAATTPNPPAIWPLSHSFLFGPLTEPAPPGHAESILHLSRSMMVILSLGCGVLIYFWSRRLWGPTAGIVSLLLWTFCPTFLAHGPLVTSDVAATLFFTASVGTFWWMLHRLSPASVLCAGLALGGLCLSKMSAPLVLPVFLLMLALRLVVGRPLLLSLGKNRWMVTIRWKQFIWLVAGIALAMVMAWGLIWAAYDFRFLADPAHGQDGVSFAAWDHLLRRGGFINQTVLFARHWSLLPEAYLYGFTFVIDAAQGRNAFLNGEFSVTGWRSYFPLAFLMKTPLLTLGIMLLGVLAGIMTLMNTRNQLRPTWRRQIGRGLYRIAPLGLFLMVYWAAAVTSHLNIGIRHMLPAYAAIYILAGCAGAWLWHTRRVLRVGMIILLLVMAVESTFAWPHYLSYFNQTVGGPSQGYRHLIDSNLDWGQDLPYVKSWLVEQGLDRPQDGNVPPGERVYLSYFGNGSIPYYGIQATLLPGFNIPAQEPPFHLPKLEAGVYIISTTMLSGTYFGPVVGTRWIAEYEKTYREIWPDIARFLGTTNHLPARQALIQELGEKYWSDLLLLYRNLRVGRLCFHLRGRQPDASITPSYRVYVLSAEEVTYTQDFPGKLPMVTPSSSE